MIITIDGPVATGKSTIARRVAEKLGFIYFDTGAMYRTLTYGMIKNKIDYENEKALQFYIDHFKFDIKLQEGEKHYYIGKEDVTKQIRGAEVTALVSKIAAFKAVRESLVGLQQSWAHGVDAVFEGRDLGSVVFPKAELKIFLSARPEVRAQRRFDELRHKFPEDTQNLTLQQTLEEISQRDHFDTHRELSPLRQAEDAILLDTSDLTIDQVVDRILNHVTHITHKEQMKKRIF